MTQKDKNENEDSLSDTGKEISIELSEFGLEPDHNDDTTNELPIPPGAYPIRITQDSVIYVDPRNGIIYGPKAEGTLGIILYGEMTKVKGIGKARAIRIPRLLSSDPLLNFHIAEISNCEGIQAAQFSSDPGLLGALTFFRLSIPNNYAHIPECEGSAFLGFYLSPTSHCNACLIFKAKAWPEEFDTYLHDISIDTGDLFELLESNAKRASGNKENNPQNLDNLFFIPHFKNVNKNINKNHTETSKPVVPLILSREKLHITSRERNVSGWWFNLPIAVYSWMTTDLQRLLTAGVEGEELKENSDEFVRLKEWPLLDWFQVFNVLALGFYYLHTKGSIHGDPRPANIMINVPPGGKIYANSFHWIDIGLGYEVNIGPVEMGQTSITPRPLGGSRTTPFYAPERIEGKELEDADHITLVKMKKENIIVLTFYIKNKTDQKPRRLRLKEKGKPVRELGTLQEGDRIQVREFLFVVKEVGEFDIVVTKIYELVLDRVLIDKTIDEESNIVLETLRSASISRYRIFKQWSQATDIYGLGNTILYTIFIRGFSKIGTSQPGIEKSVKPGDNVKEGEPPANVTNGRPPRESIFMGLSQTLRSKTFLVQILKRLAENGFAQKESICQKEILDAKYVESKSERTYPDKDISKIISNIADQIRAFDFSFEYVLKGLNDRIGLLVQLIYFCLCCVWREDEWEEIKATTTFKIMPIFQPFCKNRLKIPQKDKQGLPSEKAKDFLEILMNNISNMSESYPGAHPIKDVNLPGSKDEQISGYLNKIEELTKNLEQEVEKRENIAREKVLLQEQLKDQEKEKMSLKKKITNFDNEKEGIIEQSNQRLERVFNISEVGIKKYFEERKRSMVINFPLVKNSLRKPENHLQEILISIKNERNQKNDF